MEIMGEIPMFKIGLIGCGFMTKNGHGPSCAKYAQEHEGVLLAACCDVNLAAAQEACAAYGFQRAYTDYLEMVEQERPDVVLAITPDTITKDVSVALLERKIPVLLEKPPGLDGAQTRAIHDAAIRNHTPARVAFNRRYTPLVQALKEEIRRAAMPLLDISCLFVRTKRLDPDFSTTAIHAIDTLKFVADSDYAEAQFIYQDMEYDRCKVTNTAITASMENGATARMQFLPCGGCVVERITVTLVDFTFFLYLPVWGGLDAPGRLECLHKGKLYKTVEGGAYTLHESNGFYDESRLFFDALRSGERPESDVISGLAAVEIARAMRERKDCYRAGE